MKKVWFLERGEWNFFLWLITPPTGTGNSFLIDFKGANLLLGVRLKKDGAHAVEIWGKAEDKSAWISV